MVMVPVLSNKTSTSPAASTKRPLHLQNVFLNQTIDSSNIIALSNNSGVEGTGGQRNTEMMGKIKPKKQYKGFGGHHQEDRRGQHQDDDGALLVELTVTRPRLDRSIGKIFSWS